MPRLHHHISHQNNQSPPFYRSIPRCSLACTCTCLSRPSWLALIRCRLPSIGFYNSFYHSIPRCNRACTCMCLSRPSWLALIRCRRRSIGFYNYCCSSLLLYDKCVIKKVFSIRSSNININFYSANGSAYSTFMNVETPRASRSTVFISKP